MTRRIFEYIDDDKTGQIEGNEIVDFMRKMNAQTVEGLSSLTSHLSESEKKEAMKKSKLEFNLKVVAFVEKIDVDKNGKISFDELFTYFKMVNGIDKDQEMTDIDHLPEQIFNDLKSIQKCTDRD